MNRILSKNERRKRELEFVPKTDRQKVHDEKTTKFPFPEQFLSN